MVISGFPILATADIGRSLGFYRDLLGGTEYFRYPAEGPPGYVGVVVGTMKLGIGLAEKSPPTADRTFSLWFYVDSCDAIVEELRSHGVTVTEEPADQPWGERMARVLDPDGNEVIVAAAATGPLDNTGVASDL